MHPISSIVRAVAATVALTSLSPRLALSQDPQSQLSMSAGVATDQRGLQSNAVTLAPSLTIAASNATLGLGAFATRYTGDSWSLGGSASFAGRSAASHGLALTLNAGVAASRLGGTQTGTFSSGEIVPAAELRVSRATIFGGGRVAAGQSTLGAPAFPLGGNAGATHVSRSGVGPLYGLVIDLSPDNAGVSSQLGAREDRLRVGSDAVIDRSITLGIGNSATSFSASVGTRSAADEHVTFGSAAWAIPIGALVTLNVAGGSYPSNRLNGSLGGKYLTAGLTLRVGATHEPTLPGVTGAPPARTGLTRLTIEATDATRVELAGDFNEWNPAPATRAANGVWYADVALTPGQYRYAFRVNGREWRIPKRADAVNDGFGGKSALIIVRSDRAR